MKTKKYIELKFDKRYKGKAYINRFMHLLNVIAPAKYELNTLNLLASIENTYTNLTAVLFSDNPFK